MRTFLAIEIPENLKEKLVEIQELFKPQIPNVRWEKMEKLHITLIFLGEVGEERIVDLEEAGRQGIEGIKPFKINLSGLGFFPNERRPRVIWVGLEGEVETLIRLEKQLEDALTEFGFSFDRKKFHPHVTLGRVRPPLQGPLTLQGRKETIGGEFAVSEVTIMKSTLHPTGSVYTPLSKIPLSSTTSS